MSSFRDWTSVKLETRFGLQRRLTSEQLTLWLNEPYDFTDFELEYLRRLQQSLLINADAWNEQELSMYFIGPIFALVNFTDFGRFNFFAGRPLSAVVDKEELSGSPDGLIASGWWEPKTPYFCLYEYKKELDPSGDPFSQCLAAMLAAHALNQNNQTIYGCAVVGRNWRFMILEDRNYVVSDAYVASHNDNIRDIYRILRTLRRYIQNRIPSEEIQKAATV